MKKEEFAIIREELKTTQKKLGDLLVISTRAVQSYEQGWRAIPPCVERNLLLVLMQHRQGSKIPRTLQCHCIKNCSKKQKRHCFAYKEFSHNLCWYMTGTNFEGSDGIRWSEKIEKCRACEVFQILFKKK